MNDFEELTSLTALLEDEPEAKPGRSNARVEQAKTKKPQAKGNQAKGKQAKEGNARQRKRKRYTSTPLPNQIKLEPAGEGAKVMTSIIISEELRDWLKFQGLKSRLSMSQQIEILVRNEMKRLTRD